MTRATIGGILGLMLACANTGLAGSVPTWSYGVAFGDSLFPPQFLDLPGDPPLGAHITGTSASGNPGVIGFTSTGGPVDGEISTTTQGTQTIRLAGLWERERMTQPGLDKMNFPSENYTLYLNIRDSVSGEVGTVTISGRISGFYASESSQLQNEFETTGTLAMLKLGNMEYTVSAPTFWQPSPPSISGVNGGIDVTVTPRSMLADTPEPGTLILASFGCVFVAGRRWKRRWHARLD